MAEVWIEAKARTKVKCSQVEAPTGFFGVFFSMNFPANAVSQITRWILPRFCLLCGQTIDPGEGPDLPFCPACAASLFPIEGPRCLICGRPLISETGTCFSCRGKEAAPIEVFPIFKYCGKAGILLRGYKLGGRSSLAPFWADLMARELRTRWPERTIVPVPPRPEKLKSHLWDQVEAIATCLKERGFDVARPLMRIGSSQQKRLSKVARSENAGKSYSLSPVACLPLPNAVVIIDDVYTTGATIDACARALIAGGANRVSALVLAMD